jgi:hypothetical protein
LRPIFEDKNRREDLTEGVRVHENYLKSADKSMNYQISLLLILTFWFSIVQRSDWSVHQSRQVKTLQRRQCGAEHDYKCGVLGVERIRQV